MLKVVATRALVVLVAFVIQLGAALGNLAALVLALQPLITGIAMAQSIKVDPSAPRSQQPTLGASGTNKPVINIAPPSAGISNNKFLDLSTPNGVIFNNSATGGTSATGGAVSANPNLTGLPAANVILNEVRGTSRTSIQGSTEIFGAKADLIIANPNGVHCDGCSFVNTRRATLTTGKPTVDGANIALKVEGGIVSVWGAGMSGADEAELVGRNVVVNGPVSAKSAITASGGAQTYNYNSKAAAALPSTAARQGPYAVDATAVGAMTSGQIRIIGNESGLGVNLGGKLTATGDISVSSKGNANISNATAGGAVNVGALGTVRQPGGTIDGKKSVDIAASSIIVDKNARIVSSGPVKLNLNAYANLSGEISGSSVEVIAPKSAINMGRVVSATDIEIVAGEVQNRRDVEAQVASYTEAWINDYTDWMTWYIQRNPNDWASTYYRNLISRGEVAVQVGGASDAVLTAGQIDATRDINISADAARLYNSGSILARGDLTITAETDVVNIAALRQNGTRVCSALGCDAGYTAEAARLDGVGKLTIVAGQDIINRGSNIFGGAISLTAGRDILNNPNAKSYSWTRETSSTGATTRAYDYAKVFQNSVTLNGKVNTWIGFTDSVVEHNVDLRSVEYTGLGRSSIQSRSLDLLLKAGRDINSDGSSLVAGRTLRADAARDLSLDSKVYTNFDYRTDTYTTTETRYARNSDVVKVSNIVLRWLYGITERVYLSGAYKTGTSDSSTASSKYTSQDTAASYRAYVAGDNVQLYARGGSLTLPNAIAASGDVDLYASSSITSAYSVAAGGNATLRAGGNIDSVSIQASGDLSLRAGGSIINRDYLGSTGGRATLYAGGNLYNYDTDSAVNGGEIYGRNGVAIDVGSNVYNYNGGAIRSYGLTSVNSRAGSIYNRAVVTGRTAIDTATGAVHGTQVFTTGWTESVRLATISGRDVEISAKNDISLTGATLSASEDLVVEAGKTLDGNAFTYDGYVRRQVRDWNLETYEVSRTCAGYARYGCYRWDIKTATRWVYDDTVSVSNPTYTAANAFRGKNILITAGNVDATRLNVVAGQDLSIKTTIGDLDTEKASAMSAGRDIYLTAEATGITFDKNFSATRDLVVTARGSVINKAALSAGRSMLITSTAGNIENRSTRELFTLTASDGCFKAACGRDGIRFSPAEMIAGRGGLVLDAALSIVNQGSIIRSAGDMQLIAGTDVVNRADAAKFVIRDYSNEETKKWGCAFGACIYKKVIRDIDFLERAVLQSGVIQSGGDMSIAATRDLLVQGSTIKAVGALDILVGRNTILNASEVAIRRLVSHQEKEGVFGISIGKELESAETINSTNAFASLEGGKLWLTGIGSLYAEGAKLKSAQSLKLAITGDIVITPFKTEYYSKVVATSSGFLGTNRNEFEQTINKTVVASSSATAGRDLTFESASGDVVLQASKLNAGGNITLSAKQGKIVMLVDKEKVAQQTKTHKENMVWWKATDSGSVVETLLYNELKAGGSVAFEAGKGMLVEYKEGGSVDDAIRTLARKPELAWMQQLQVRNDVEWQPVRAEFDQWYNKTEGLTQGAAAVIAIAVTIATQGAGSALLGLEALGLAGTPMAFAIDAGFSTLASRATVSLANNKGDIGAVLKELGSEDFVKQLATSMLTAGLTAGLPTSLLPRGGDLSFAQTLQANIVKNIVSTSVRTAMYGGKFEKDLLNGLKLAAVDALGVVAAREIGSAYDGKSLDYVTHKIAHAALGCALGAAQSSSSGNGCVSGAVGGVAAEIVAGEFRDYLNEKLDDAKLNAKKWQDNPILMLEASQQLEFELEYWKAKGIDASKFAAAITAFAIGGDVNTAASVGENAARNNALWFVVPLAVMAWKAYSTYDTISSAVQFIQEIEKNGGMTDDMKRRAIENILIDAALKFGTSGLSKVVEKLGIDLKKYGDQFLAAVQTKIDAACKGGKCTIPGQCFVAGTLVWTTSGAKAIEDVRPGDLVLSRAESGGEDVYRPVVRTFTRRANQIVRVTLEHANGEYETLGTTMEHPFHVSGRGFVKAGELKPGMMVTSLKDVARQPEPSMVRNQTPWLRRVALKDDDVSGAVMVKSLSLEERSTIVYNFEVAETHTYAVGASKAWVHNDCGPEVSKYLTDGTIRLADDIGSKLATGAIKSGDELAVGSGMLIFKSTKGLSEYELQYAIDAAKAGSRVEIRGGSGSAGLDFFINGVPFELATVTKNDYATTLNALTSKISSATRTAAGSNILIDGRGANLSVTHGRQALEAAIAQYPRNAIPDISVYTSGGLLRYVNGKIE